MPQLDVTAVRGVAGVGLKSAKARAAEARLAEAGSKAGSKDQAPPAADAQQRPARPAGLPTAKGAILLAVPLSILLTTIIILKSGISPFWAIPVYGVIGAVFAVVLLML